MRIREILLYIYIYIPLRLWVALEEPPISDKKGYKKQYIHTHIIIIIIIESYQITSKEKRQITYNDLSISDIRLSLAPYI